MYYQVVISRWSEGSRATIYFHVYSAARHPANEHNSLVNDVSRMYLQYTTLTQKDSPPYGLETDAEMQHIAVEWSKFSEE